MLFSWYAADLCTDPTFAGKGPEERANPSMASWNNPDYLEQQRRRLPAHKFRRLHLNLPGLPEGSAFQVGPITDAIERGIATRTHVAGVTPRWFVDMSGGSNDDAYLSAGYKDADGRAVQVTLVDQGQRPPFDPMRAVERFARIIKHAGGSSVTGDAYAGETFRAAFEAHNIEYHVSRKTRSQLYEALEPRLNAHQVVLLDLPVLEQQLLGLVWRGGKIDHPGGEHDDAANATAGMVDLVLSERGDYYAWEIDPDRPYEDFCPNYF
jgi:hypothetical protein